MDRSLRQPWDVFAPDPVHSETVFEAAVTFSDGSSAMWRPPHASAVFAYRSHRWELWKDRLVEDEYSPWWEETARWIAEQYDGKRRQPVRVALRRRWSLLPPPGVDPRLRAWNEFKFTRCTCENPRRRLDRFWFTPQATSTLALLRIAFGLLTTVWTLVLLPDAAAFFGSGGLVNGHAAAPLVLAALLAAALAVAFGLFARVACCTVFFSLVWLHRVNPLIWNTGDVLLRHLALFLALSPAGDALSADRWRRERDLLWDFPARAPWALRLVQVQVALMYVVTVFAKLQSEAWRKGEAVSYILRIPEDARFAFPSAMTSSKLWAAVLTYGALAVEAAIPLLVWKRRTRPFILVLGAGLHLAIELTLRVGLFSWIVLVTYLAFVPPETATRFFTRFRRVGTGAPSHGGRKPAWRE